MSERTFPVSNQPGEPDDRLWWLPAAQEAAKVYAAAEEPAAKPEIETEDEDNHSSLAQPPESLHTDAEIPAAE